jgi:hypothetical protein
VSLQARPAGQPGDGYEDWKHKTDDGSPSAGTMPA